MDKIVVDIDNMRLDAYISKINSNISRTMVQKLIQEGNVLIVIIRSSVLCSLFHRQEYVVPFRGTSG